MKDMRACRCAHWDRSISYRHKPWWTRWLGLQLHGSISTINGLDYEKTEVENRFVHFCSDGFYCLWLNKRVKGRALQKKCIQHNTTLFCLLSLSCILFAPSRPIATTVVLSSAAWLSAWVVYFGLYLEQGPRQSRGSEAGAPRDKADRNTVTCVSVVRVGMDETRSTFKRLPVCARWIESGSHSCGGRPFRPC